MTHVAGRFAPSGGRVAWLFLGLALGDLVARIAGVVPPPPMCWPLQWLWQAGPIVEAIANQVALAVPRDLLVALPAFLLWRGTARPPRLGVAGSILVALGTLLGPPLAAAAFDGLRASLLASEGEARLSLDSTPYVVSQAVGYAGYIAVQCGWLLVGLALVRERGIRAAFGARSALLGPIAFVLVGSWLLRIVAGGLDAPFDSPLWPQRLLEELGWPLVGIAIAAALVAAAGAWGLLDEATVDRRAAQAVAAWAIALLVGAAYVLWADAGPIPTLAFLGAHPVRGFVFWALETLAAIQIAAASAMLGLFDAPSTRRADVSATLTR
jgi:hypothetical protein